MNDGRLPTHVEASSLLRRAESGGGFGMVLRKGDADRGALLLLIASRGDHFACLERVLGSTGYAWQAVGPTAGSDAQSLSEWTSRRARFDEDLWLIELDIPDPQRFIAETTASG